MNHPDHPTGDRTEQQSRSQQPRQTPEPPATGQPEVDRALDSLQGLENEPLSVHHDRLAQAHEDLHRALNTDSESPA